MPIDNAPWHRCKLIDAALADHPHPECHRPSSYNPQLNVIERFWKLLRRRATHDTTAPLTIRGNPKRSLRASLCCYQTMRGRVRSLIAGCCAQPRKADGITGRVNENGPVFAFDS